MDQKLNRLIPLLKSRTGPAIVYVTLQKQAEEVADLLRPHDLDPMVYHAGLPSEERMHIQNAFMSSEKGIVCATIAFGMGVDCPDIRQVRYRPTLAHAGDLIRCRSSICLCRRRLRTIVKRSAELVAMVYHRLA